MDTPQPVPGKRPASTILTGLGGMLMLLALVSAFILYLWGRTSTSGGGEQWNDVISIVYILFGSLPVLGIGLILLFIGLVLRFRSADKKEVPSES